MHSRLHPFIVLLVTAVLVLILTPFAFAADTDVVFSEIMINAASSEPSGEWVELYNQGSAGVDLAGWTIRDGFASDTIGTSMCPGGSCVLPARDVWLITPDPTALQTEFDDYSNPGSQSVDSSRTIDLGSSIGNGLANTGDYLVLSNSADTPVDCVSWDGSSHCDGLAYVPPGDGFDNAPTGSDGQSITNIGGMWYDHEVNASPYDADNAAANGTPTALVLSSLTVRQPDARWSTMGVVALLVAAFGYTWMSRRHRRRF